MGLGSNDTNILLHPLGSPLAAIGRVSLGRENEVVGSWGQEVHILHVNIYDFVLFWL